jgi:hypothetical protein
VDADAVVLQHGDEGLGELGVAVIGVGVDEQQHLFAGAAVRARQAALRGR